MATTTNAKKEENHVLRIAIFVVLLDAGVSSRGVEIAKALREAAATRRTEKGGSSAAAEISFFSWDCRSVQHTYEHLVTDERFDVRYYGPTINQVEWAALRQSEQTGRGFEGLEGRMAANIRGAMDAIRTFRPHVVVHG